MIRYVEDQVLNELIARDAPKGPRKDWDGDFTADDVMAPVNVWHQLSLRCVFHPAAPTTELADLFELVHYQPDDTLHLQLRTGIKALRVIEED